MIAIASTYPDNFVLGASSQVFTVWAETDTPDIQIVVFQERAVLKMSSKPAVLDVKNLSRSVAAGGYISTIETEAHAADDTLMGQVVHQVDVQNTSDARIEDGEPVVALFFVVFAHLIELEIGEGVANIGMWPLDCCQRILRVTGWRRGTRYLRRTRIRCNLRLLGRCRTGWSSYRAVLGTG